MLILTRKPGESVTLTDTTTGRQLATVTISSVRGEQVRVAFEADPNIKIMRDDAVVREQKR